jgi:hypothetical protein
VTRSVKTGFAYVAAIFQPRVIPVSCRFSSTTRLGILPSPVREDAVVYPRQPPTEDREGAEFWMCLRSSQQWKRPFQGS